MRADGDVGFFLFEQFDERLSVQTVKCQPPPFILPGLVERIIHPAENFGHGVDHIDISLAVKTPEKRIGVIENVYIFDFSAASFWLELFFEGARRAQMSRADRRR